MTDTKQIEHCDHPVARNDVIDLPRFVNGIREFVLGQLHGILDADGYDRVRSVDPAWLTNTVLESQAQPLPIRPNVYISETEAEAFNRFCECCEDSGADGYDVSQEMMKRLTEVGLVRSLGFKRYTTTRYGDAIRALKQQAPEPVAVGSLTDKQLDDLVIKHGWVYGDDVCRYHFSADDLRALLSSVAPRVPDVDWLSNVIRAADGNNTLGAGALAEKIVEAMIAAAQQVAPEGYVIVPVTLLEWAQQNIDNVEDEDERKRISASLGDYIADAIPTTAELPAT